MKITPLMIAITALYAAAGYLLYEGLLWAGFEKPLAQTAGTLYLLFFTWRTFFKKDDDE